MHSLKRLLRNGNSISSFILPVLLILTLFAVVIFVGVHQLSETEERLHEEALANLNLNAQVVSQQLNDMYVSLEGEAPVLAFEEGFTQKQMQRSMAALRDAYGFDFVVRTNLSGIAFNYLGKENIDISTRHYIRTALQGQRSCAYVDAGTYDPSSAYVILAVPIFYQRQVVGVVHGSYKVANFDALLVKLAENGQNYSSGTFLFGAEGQLIAASHRTTDCGAFSKLLRRQPEADKKAAEAVAANLKAGKSGFVPVTINGAREYAYYAPITDEESCPWVMVTTVSEASMLERTRSLKNGILMLFVVAVCITIALLLSMFRHQRLLALQQENAVKLAQALGAARLANRAKSDFLSRMSHDMRTPLNGIIGMTYLAQEVKNPPRTEHCLEKIATSSQFLLGLINDVLDMAKAESGKMELHPEPYDLQQLIAYVEAVVKPLCTEKGIQLVFDLQPVKNCKPVIDPLRFNQLCFNLLSNAVKYTPEGGTVTLSIHDRQLTDTRLAMELEVSDTGIGMSEEFQKTMFEPFTQENRSDTSKARGSGLGLAIAKRVIDLMQGRMTLHSKLGEGTTYHIYFEFDSVPELQAEQTAVKSKADYNLLTDKHVLLCEDHPLNQEISKTLLQEKGMVVVIAENGLAGLEAFTSSAPGYYDLILMDIRMPLMNGYEATKNIRALKRSDAQTVPIIAMTADAFAESIAEAERQGMDAYLTKPLEPAKLFAALQKYLERQQSAGAREPLGQGENKKEN